MGKTARLRGDLDDVAALLEIISVLKDVSTNRFFQFAQQKEDLAKFLQVFLLFFDMLNATDSNCPLVKNDHPGIDIICVTSEASFMSNLNGRVARAACNEYAKSKNTANLVCVGWRGADKCKSSGAKVARLYRDTDAKGLYATSLEVRDYMIERMMSGETGRIVCCYGWAKSFNILKPRIVTLLPASELLGGEQVDAKAPAGGEEEEAERETYAASAVKRHFIQESSTDGIMKVLADVWVSSRLFEILADGKLTEAAAQSQQLEQSIEGLSKEKKAVGLSLKKSQRADLNKAMREVFTSAKVCKKR